MSGLSCRLFPFLLLDPHLHPASRAKEASSLPGGPPLLVPSAVASVPPLKIAPTLEWAHRGCFRIALMTAMHSVITRPTGSTATVSGIGLGGMRMAISAMLAGIVRSLSRYNMFVVEDSLPCLCGNYLTSVCYKTRGESRRKSIQRVTTSISINFWHNILTRKFGVSHWF